ncbi:hypothetical protein JSE7799_01422 [Jannaschia seosinensis]|uniref:Glycosyl transferase n=1 Tax=Jannaschia seosinensis TaxID=313367 RepID=A0A0M7BBJ7_9RHOB|nr:hypothetical protein [Jannaschia seosinensis]CUH38489.1 hypothetical protein JSE7799_01422 [Jannaschia seosinensis]
MKQIVCMRWGKKYGPEYVNRLYGMIARNITPPFKLFCLTDDASGVRPEVDCRPMADLGFEMPKLRRGIWHKSRLWMVELSGIEGVVLFVDLDVVITGSLDPFFTYGADDDVILARNPVKPFERLGQTSLYRFKVGTLAPLWEEFRADPKAVGERWTYEQRFVTNRAPGGVTFWPRGWVVHYRHHCVPFFPANFVMEPRLPKGARVAIFAGQLNPADAVIGRYQKDYPVLSPSQHVRRALTGPAPREGRMKYLRHFVRPSSWVREHWRE